MTEIFQKVSKRIESYENDMVEFQRLLTSVPALCPSSGGEGEGKKAEIILNYLKTIGFNEIIELNAQEQSGITRPNIIALYRGKSSEKTIWIMSHMDVVPPGELNLWNSNPYEIAVKGRKIYGRGTEDNQQSLVASVFALKAIKEEHIMPLYDTGIVIVSDEETGSELGLGYVLKKYDKFRHNDYIIVPDSGSIDGSMIEIAEKSILWIEFTTTGKQCHASRPSKGINSFKAASHLVVLLEELYNIYSKEDPLFEPPVSTFEPTKKEANVPNINTIPGKDVFCLDCRILPCYPIDDVLKTIREICDKIERKFNVKIDISIVQKEQAAPPTPENAPVVYALGTSIKKVLNVEPVAKGIGGGTVAALFRNNGLHAAVWGKIDGMAHQPNEYCTIDNMLDEAKVFAHLLLTCDKT